MKKGEFLRLVYQLEPVLKTTEFAWANFKPQLLPRLVKILYFV